MDHYRESLGQVLRQMLAHHPEPSILGRRSKYQLLMSVFESVDPIVALEVILSLLGEQESVLEEPYCPIRNRVSSETLYSAALVLPKVLRRVLEQDTLDIPLSDEHAKTIEDLGRRLVVWLPFERELYAYPGFAESVLDSVVLLAPELEESWQPLLEECRRRLRLDVRGRVLDADTRFPVHCLRAIAKNRELTAVLAPELGDFREQMERALEEARGRARPLTMGEVRACETAIEAADGIIATMQ